MTGVVNLLKPPGMSSQTAVTKVRRLFDMRKAGHAGTLDPGACGVLPVCLGRATKLSSYLMGGEKEYVAELLTGVQTDTLDTYGAVVATSGARPGASEVLSVLPCFTGTILQAPPAYSALKVDGRPMYEYARRGQTVPRPERQVQVHAIELVEQRATDRFLFRIRCSKGTYVRTLLADIASNLGTVGCVSFLERTVCGSMRLEDAVTLDEIALAIDRGDVESVMIPPLDALGAPRVDLPPHLHDVLLSGSRIDLSRVSGLRLEEGPVYGVCCRGEFFGAGVVEGGLLRICARIRVHEP